MTESKKRLASSHALEMLCVEIYESLAGLFPESRELWDSLRKDEEKHAEVMIRSYALEMGGALPETIVYPSLASIKEAVMGAREMKEKLEKGEVGSLDEALGMSLSLEESGVDGYLADVLSKETDSSILAHFRDIIADEKSHVQRIEEFMSARG
jgi:rubrerythrin